MIPDLLMPTVMQLRAYCAPFGGRVAGAANFSQGLEHYNANMALPAAYVVPLPSDSEGFDSMTGTYQYVRRHVGVVVELDARADRRGQDPMMNLYGIESALCATLLNWLPAACITKNQQGYWFAGGQFLDLDRARVFYQWAFGLNCILDDSDGWQPEAIPLEQIELDIYKAPPWQMPPHDPAIQPAAIVKIDTNPQPAASLWDNGQSIWDGGASIWDGAGTNLPPGSLWDDNQSTWDGGASEWDSA